MATRDIAHADIMRSRNLTVTVNDDQAAEVISLQKIKDGIVSLSEEIKEDVYEVEDGTEIINKFARKCTFEFIFSEVDSTDIAALAVDGGEIELMTSEGGANGTGKTLTVTACDSIIGLIDDLKTKIIAVKITAIGTLPYTITDNAA